MGDGERGEDRERRLNAREGAITFSLQTHAERI
jgi:hypothetical protein